MFASKNQFVIFVICVFFGGLAGVFFQFLSCFRVKIKNNYLWHAINLILYLILGFLFILGSNLYNFPSFRWYMILGFLIGKTLYRKSLGIILANFIKKIYNVIRMKFTFKRKKTNDGKQV